MKKLYVKIKDAKGNISKGYILDLSQGGMAIACSEMIKINTIVEVKIESNVLAPLRGKIISVFNRQKKVYGYRLGVRLISTEKVKNKKLAIFIKGAEKRKKIRLKLL